MKPGPKPVSRAERVGGKVSLRLVADHSTRLYVRRRDDRQRLRGCEIDWIAVHGGEQAKCPRRCPDYVERAS